MRLAIIVSGVSASNLLVSVRVEVLLNVLARGLCLSSRVVLAVPGRTRLVWW